METTVKQSKALDIAAAVRDGIKAGAYSGRMPTDRELAARYGVNANTIGLALCRLESEGLVSRKRKIGTWVLSPSAARPPRPGGIKTVALLMRTNEHLFGVLSGLIVRQFQALGWQCMVFDSAYSDGDDFSGFMDRIAAARPDAVVADIQYQFPWEELVRRLPQEARLLRIGHPTGRCERARHLLSDWFGGAHAATEHLLKLGRRRILLVDSLYEAPPQYYPQTSHYAFNMGYRKTLDEAGLAGRELFFFNNNHDEAEDACRLWKLFGSANRPDAVLAFGDFRAVQCMRVIAGLGLRVPDDVAVVGFYDTPWCEATSPRLTSVSIEPECVARAIAEAIAAPEFPLESIVISTRLVLRESALAAKDENVVGQQETVAAV